MDDLEEVGEQDPLDLADSDNPMFHTTVGRASKLESDIFGMLQVLLHCMCVTVLLFEFISPVTQVSGSSMEPTFLDGELLLVNMVNYHLKPEDIVIINNPTITRLDGNSFVKRIIAVGGDRVEINYDQNRVYVNGIPIDEPYLGEAMRPIYGNQQEEIEVPEGFLFVLGDNRNYSTDSRSEEIGLVDERYVIGKVFLSIWPISAWTFY